MTSAARCKYMLNGIPYVRQWNDHSVQWLIPTLAINNVFPSDRPHPQTGVDQLQGCLGGLKPGRSVTKRIHGPSILPWLDQATSERCFLATGRAAMSAVVNCTSLSRSWTPSTSALRGGERARCHWRPSIGPAHQTQSPERSGPVHTRARPPASCILAPPLLPGPACTRALCQL